MMAILLGPISSGTPSGPGIFFSYLFILMGCYVLARTWVFYSQHRRENSIPVLNPIGISLLSLFFIGVGLYGVLR
jgi:hypothetical protein